MHGQKNIKLYHRISKNNFKNYVFSSKSNNTFAVLWLPQHDWDIYIAELDFRLPVW